MTVIGAAIVVADILGVPVTIYPAAEHNPAVTQARSADATT